MKIDPYISPGIKLNSRLTKDLNIRPDSLNLIKRGNGLEIIGTRKDSLNRTLTAQALRTTSKQLAS